LQVADLLWSRERRTESSRSHSRRQMRCHRQIRKPCPAMNIIIMSVVAIVDQGGRSPRPRVWYDGSSRCSTRRSPDHRGPRADQAAKLDRLSSMLALPLVSTTTRAASTPGSAPNKAHHRDHRDRCDTPGLDRSQSRRHRLRSKRTAALTRVPRSRGGGACWSRPGRAGPSAGRPRVSARTDGLVVAGVARPSCTFRGSIKSPSPPVGVRASCSS